MQHIKVQEIPIEQLKPNDYNPNEMSEDEFAELHTEIEHLGTVPKPIVVRLNGDGYVIVDGEHSYMAAQSVGLATLPCEVLELDDFEAMRQTYKRNQHGKHNLVKQGEMFARMLEARGISQRELANEIEVSEGTIRNSLLYTEADKLYSSPFSGIERLSVRQVRFLLTLPKTLGNAWLSEGADLEKFEKSLGRAFRDPSSLIASAAANGLFDYVKGSVNKILRRAAELEIWESRWARGGITREVLRQYTRWHLENKWAVRETHMMDSALRMLIDPSTAKTEWVREGKASHMEWASTAAFRLSPDEFADAINTPQQTGEPESHGSFMNRLRAMVIERTGETVRDSKWVKQQLTEKELEAAPDYIRDSKLDWNVKYALWKMKPSTSVRDPDDPELFEAAKQDIARQGIRTDGDDLAPVLWEAIRRYMWKAQSRDKFHSKTTVDLAAEIVQHLGLYDPKDTAQVILMQQMAERLLTLRKEELFLLGDYVLQMRMNKDYHESLLKAFGPRNGYAPDVPEVRHVEGE